MRAKGVDLESSGAKGNLGAIFSNEKMQDPPSCFSATTARDFFSLFFSTGRYRLHFPSLCQVQILSIINYPSYLKAHMFSSKGIKFIFFCFSM
jgi:hypothetical protein